MKKSRKRWLWTAMCRRTRQIIAFIIGDRSAKTCAKLWKRIPESYKSCHSFSDLWEAYSKVFPKDSHHSVPKQAGETCHIERFNNTLHQRLARYVRKTYRFLSPTTCIMLSPSASSSTTTDNASRIFMNVLTIREQMGLSRAQFSRLIGVSARTLEGWEQGRREPSGPAKMLLKVVSKHPDIVREVVSD